MPVLNLSLVSTVVNEVFGGVPHLLQTSGQYYN